MANLFLYEFTQTAQWIHAHAWVAAVLMPTGMTIACWPKRVK